MGMYKDIYKVYDGRYIGRTGANSFALTARVRFDWFRSTYVNLYSTIGVGLILNDIYSIYITSEDNSHYLNPWFGVDLTPIGVMAGKRLFGFAEIGAGPSGWGRIGIGYRFDTNKIKE